MDVPVPHEESLRRVEEVLNRELPDRIVFEDNDIKFSSQW